MQPMSETKVGIAKRESAMIKRCRLAANPGLALTLSMKAESATPIVRPAKPNLGMPANTFENPRFEAVNRDG